jgi:hypothetical protein
MTLSIQPTTVRRAFAAACLGASMMLAGVAGAQHTSCPPKQSSVIESKACPNGAVVQRACCTKDNHKGEKTRCKSFPKCPHKSRG